MDNKLPFCSVGHGYGWGDLLLGGNAEAFHEPRPAGLGTYVCKPIGYWQGHAAVIPIRQWGHGSALLTRKYLGYLTSVSIQYSH